MDFDRARLGVEVAGSCLNIRPLIPAAGVGKLAVFHALSKMNSKTENSKKAGPPNKVCH